MLIPGLSGHEGRVRHHLRQQLTALGIASATDRQGNLIATIEGSGAAPKVMLFAHMDQLGFVVRKIEADGFLRVERLGGVDAATGKKLAEALSAHDVTRDQCASRLQKHREKIKSNADARATL